MTSLKKEENAVQSIDNLDESEIQNPSSLSH
jgi:hypothetical protein